MQPCPPAKATCEHVTLGELQSNARGGKAAALQPAIRLALQGVTTPFQVSSFDGNSTRKPFKLRSTPEPRAFAERLEQCVSSHANAALQNKENIICSRHLKIPKCKGAEAKFSRPACGRLEIHDSRSGLRASAVSRRKNGRF